MIKGRKNFKGAKKRRKKLLPLVYNRKKMLIEFGPTNSFGISLTLDKGSFTILFTFLFLRVSIDDTTEAESL